MPRPQQGATSSGSWSDVDDLVAAPRQRIVEAHRHAGEVGARDFIRLEREAELAEFYQSVGQAVDCVIEHGP